MTAPLLRRRRPCERCPFRRDLVGIASFPNLREYAAGTCVEADGTGPDVGAPLFACHKDGTAPARLCAGWLAVEGHAHPSVRLARSMGLLPAEALDVGDGWPELFESAVEMIAAQAYDARLEPRPSPAAAEGYISAASLAQMREPRSRRNWERLYRFAPGELDEQAER